MDLLDDEQAKSQDTSQRFYTLEQLGDLSYATYPTSFGSGRQDCVFTKKPLEE
nr:hypothetical protein [uncultured Dysosmobacter sp.]